MKGLQDIVHDLRRRGVALKATEQPIDTGTAAGKAFLDMLGVFAEFETNLRRERQMEGIAAAKAKGVYKGRPATIDLAEIRRLHQQERLGPAAIARRLGIARSSVYRVLPVRPLLVSTKVSVMMRRAFLDERSDEIRRRCHNDCCLIKAMSFRNLPMSA